MVSLHSNADRALKMLTFLQPSPQCSLIGPSMPNDTPLNHQKHAKMVNAMPPNVYSFVFSEKRRDEKMKWSSICPSISTAKYSVGSYAAVSQHAGSSADEAVLT